MINGDIEIKIIEVEGDKVRIGISAPSNVEIHRKEIYEKIIEENKEAVYSKNFINDVKEFIIKKNKED
jgi:carbon storage regulator